MSQTYYYTLATSLPALPRFDRAERLPITREKLVLRLSMLEPDDAQLLKSVESYLFWRGQAKKENEADLAKQYHLLTELSMPEELKEFIFFRISERTIMVALRRKFRGLPAPAAGETWGLGRWVGHIEKNWDDPDFRLAGVYPWIPKARELLHAGETLELERFILNHTWKLLDQFSSAKEFLFESIVAYVFKWNILQYWLGFNPEAARKRFETLVGEVYDENAKFVKF
jgi:hypothetical protein